MAIRKKINDWYMKDLNSDAATRACLRSTPVPMEGTCIAVRHPLESCPETRPIDRLFLNIISGLTGLFRQHHFKQMITKETADGKAIPMVRILFTDAKSIQLGVRLETWVIAETLPSPFMKGETAVDEEYTQKTVTGRVAMLRRDTFLYNFRVL